MDLHTMDIPTYDEIKSGLLKLISEGKMSREDAALVLPELSESEDEKILKELIEYAQDTIRSYNNMVSGDYDSRDKEDKLMHEWWKNVLVYLEKQKEQKPAEKPDLVAELKHHLSNRTKR